MTEDLDRAPEIQVALEALAANAGSLAPTCRQLEEEGRPVSKDRLKKWARVEHPGMYREARIKQAEAVKEFLADKHHAAAIRDLELEERVTKRLEERLENDELEHKDELSLKGKAGLGSAIHTDKGQMLDADPIVPQTANPIQIQINLKRKFGVEVRMPGEVLEGEAEEIEDSAA
jgi:hypothetical protein